MAAHPRSHVLFFEVARVSKPKDENGLTVGSSKSSRVKDGAIEKVYYAKPAHVFNDKSILGVS